MPEMADIEVLKRRFNQDVTGQTVTAVKIINPALVKSVSGLEEKLTGKKILDSQRYGKYLFVKIGQDGYLILHFGLTGHLIFEKDKEKSLRQDAMLVISTESLNLIYEAKIYGMAGWCTDPKNFIAEKKLGPDAGALTESEFIHVLRCSKGPIKPALMDQQRIAGVGNVYADEILFQAKIHPQVPIKSLSVERLKKIYEAVHLIHESAVKVSAVRTQMPDWALMKIRKTSTLCPKCGGTLKNILVNSRETLFCPQCQHL